MKRYFLTIGAAVAAFIGAGCSNFLTCDSCVKDPNRQLTASMANLLTGIEASMGLQWNSHIARTASMWVQQNTGTDRQYKQIGSTYVFTEGDFDGEFSGPYTAGGLIDIRKLEVLADSLGDQRFGGIARTIEAFDMGMAASIWGDVPYSQADQIDTYPEPVLDPQADVYAAVQAKLDTAVALLTAGGGSGPGGADVWLGGNVASWLAVAHTLKGRFYMHWAEAQVRSGAPAAAVTAAQTACGGDCVQKALAEFPNGILLAKNSLTANNSSTPGEWNWWYQFTQVDRSGYISPGKTLVDTMVARSDPRLAEYFSTVNGAYIGAAIGQGAGGKSEIGSDPGQRAAIDFRQPMVTADENLLHWAEAAFYAGQAGPALTQLNAYQAANGLATTSPSGNALLQEIAVQLWIAQYQNPDAYNDWKRTCWPNITPAVAGENVPARPLYGISERNANTNIPAPSAQPLRNLNDPLGGTVTDAIGATCLGSNSGNAGGGGN